jgi:hypothetical protein
MRGRMGGMRFRKLRIAWSVVCAIASVLLIALWVRSYWWVDFIEAPIGTNGCSLSSVRGHLGLDARPSEAAVTGWHYSGGRMDEPQELADTPQPNSDDDMSNSFSVTTVTTTELPRIVTLTHGLLSLLFAILAALPWLRYRFSLRTLLIATTLVAVVLGAIAYATR